jgi:hypothetical protein
MSLEGKTDRLRALDMLPAELNPLNPPNEDMALTDSPFDCISSCPLLLFGFRLRVWIPSFFMANGRFTCRNHRTKKRKQKISISKVKGRSKR